MARNINEIGLALIKQFEGCKLSAYKCPAGVWTIGYGSTGAHVYEGLKITQEQADDLLRKDLLRFEEGVSKLCPVASDNQFSALVSFAFNLGLGSLQTSTLRRMHNEGNYEAAAGQFTRWNKAKGKVLNGLTRRREAEARLYRSKV